MIKLALDFALLALLAYAAFRFYGRYQVATGTVWQRFKAAVLASYTLYIQYITGVLVFVAPYLETGATALNLPEVTTFIHDYLPTDKAATAVFWVLILTILARLRRLPSPE